MQKEVRSKNLIIQRLQTPESEIPVWQRKSDGYINATQICQAADRRFGNWYRLDDTKQYLDAVSRYAHISADLLVQIIDKGPNSQRGTWVHPRVALRIAQWCSPDFAAQVDEWLEAWLKGDLQADSEAVIRAFLYPHAQKWVGTFSHAFYYQLDRLYGIKFDPAKGAPENPYAALVTHKLIYSRLPGEIQAALRHYNPVIEGERKRARKNFQFFRKDYKMALDNMIDLCSRIMERFNDKNKFECAWDMMCPHQNMKQLELIPMDYYLEIE